MDQAPYFRLLLIALCSLSECSRRQYHYVNMRRNWSEAKRYCLEHYTNLATVSNMKEMEQLMGRVNISENVFVWIGLEITSVYKWKWSLGDPVNYINWENGPSTNTNDCVFMRNGKWYHQSCNILLSFICYDSKDEQYILETSQKTWRDAQSFCQQNYADLVSVRNQTENLMLEKIINDSQKSVWIGLFSDSWEWSDKSDSSFRNWMSGEPNGGLSPQCTLASVKQGQWNDGSCSDLNTFVCHKDNLLLIKENLSWPEALRYCRENHGDLVSVDSEEIQQWVTEVVKQASTAEVWLGMHYYCYMNLWIWVREEIVCYQNWAPGNGTAQESCGTLRAGAVQSGGDHRWISRPHTHKLNFICSRYDY